MKASSRISAVVNRATLVCMAIAVSVASATSSGCSSCEDEVVQREASEAQQIAVIHRVCGSVAGFNVSVAPPGTYTSGHADEFEPFMYVCDCYDQPARRPYPVTVSVEPGKTLRVRYDKRGAWQIVKQRSTQSGFRVMYEATGGGK